MSLIRRRPEPVTARIVETRYCIVCGERHPAVLIDFVPASLRGLIAPTYVEARCPNVERSA